MDYSDRSPSPRTPESIWARRTLWASIIFFPAILVTLPPAVAQVWKGKQRGGKLILWASLITIAQIIIVMGLIWAATFWLSQNPNFGDLFRGII